MSRALELALAEIENKVLICCEVMAEEGIEFDETMKEFTVDFIMKHMSAKGHRTLVREFKAGRGAAVSQRLMDTIQQGGRA